MISHCNSKEHQEAERDEDEGSMSVASVGLLRSKLSKLRKEIAAEEEVEKSIQEKMRVKLPWFSDSGVQ